MPSWFECSVRRPKTVGALLVILTLVAAGGLTQLRFDDDYRSVFRSDGPDYRALEEITAIFGREDNDLVVVVDGPDVLAPESLAFIWDLHQAIAEVDSVESVYSVASLPAVAIRLRRGGPAMAASLSQARDAIAGNSLVSDKLLSRDARTTILMVHLGDAPLTVQQLEPRVAAIREAIAGVPPVDQARVRITGIPEIRVDVIRTVQRDQIMFNIVLVLVAGALGLLIFRRAAALVILGTGPLLGVVWTLGALGWAGEPLNVMNNVVPQLVLAIGFTDAVHLLYTFQRSARGGRTSADAALEAIRHVGPACALTSLTTAIGFGSLAFTTIELVRHFGLACAAGTVLGYVAVLATVPLLVGTRLGSAALTRPSPGRARNFAARLVQTLEPATQRPLMVTCLACVAAGLLLAVALQVRPDFRFTENLPSSSEALLALQHRDAELGGSAPVFVWVRWGEGRTFSNEVANLVEAVHETVADDPDTYATTSIVDLLEASGRRAPPGRELDALSRLPPDLVERWLNPEARSSLVAALVPDDGAAALSTVVQRLRQRLAALGNRASDAELTVAGLTVVSTQTSLGMIGDLNRSLGVAVLLICVILAVAFGSVRLGLISMVPNVLPLLGVGALLFVTGRPLQYTSVAVFAVGLGLAVDDTIHFLTAYRRGLATGRSIPESVRFSLETVGPALCATTALLVAGLATLWLGEMPMVQLFGLLMCALLVLALIADLVVLPAMLQILHRRVETARGTDAHTSSAN